MFSYGFPKHWSTLRKLLWLKLLQGAAAVVETVTGTLPLTLANALSHAILSLTRYGLCEQRNLPLGYTQLDYIEGNGTTSYLDTGIVLNTVDLDVEVDFQYTELPAAPSPTLVWGYKTGASSRPRWGFGTYSSKWLGSVNQTTTAGTNDTNRHTAVMRVFMDGENPMWDGTLDGTALYEPTTLAYLATFTGNTIPVYLFARNDSDTAGSFAQAKIYRFKVTKAGELINDLIPCKRDADNAAGVYDVVNGTFITGVDITAGTEAVPSPSTPMDIVCNNGALKYSANMADVNEQTAMVGYYINAQGAVLADQYNWYYQLFVPVKPNTSYTLSMSTPVYYVTISEYSTPEDSGFVIRKNGTTGSNSSLTITTGANTNFLRFGANINRSPITLETVLGINWMLNIGDTAMDYQPYVAGSIYTDGTPEVLTVSGKNLINPDAAGVVNGSYISDSGNQVSDNVSFLSDYILVAEGETYTAQGYRTSGTATANLRVHGFDASKTWTQMLAKEPMLTDEVTSASFTIPSGVKYVRVCGYIGYRSGRDAMLELGSTATAYEPYTPQTVTVPMLLGVGDTKDEGELIHGLLTHKIGIMVFDGTEAWRASSSGGGIYVLSSALGVGLTAICTHFVNVSNTTSAANMSDGSFKGHPSQTVLYFKDEAVGSLADFKAWLAAQYAAGTPVIMLYQLATETTEQTTAHHLSTHQGANIVDSVANVGPVEAKVEYMKVA